MHAWRSPKCSSMYARMYVVLFSIVVMLRLAAVRAAGAPLLIFFMSVYNSISGSNEGSGKMQKELEIRSDSASVGSGN